jgi:hypothetical protein
MDAGVERCRAGFAPSNRDFQRLMVAFAERAQRPEDSAARQGLHKLCHIAWGAPVDLHGLSAVEARAVVLCMLAVCQVRSIHRAAPGLMLT